MKLNVFHIALFASTISLIAALAVQYGFGLVPCELCIMQRWPYVAVIILSLGGLLKPACRKWLLYLTVISFVAGGGIATYHAAVEKHIVKGPAACTGADFPSGQSIEEFLKHIENAPVVACDQPQWEFHGITMALMNALWSFLLAVIVMLSARKRGDNARITR